MVVTCELRVTGRKSKTEKRKKYYYEVVLQNVNVRNQPEVNGIAGI
jgi:hypothetical protein